MRNLLLATAATMGALLATTGAALAQPVKQVAPGTVAVHLNGYLQFSIADVGSSGNTVGGEKLNPITTDGGEDKLGVATLNAQLALNISLGLLIDWNMLDLNKFARLLEADVQIRSFLKEHILWLTNLDSRYYLPGFSNAQVWKLFHYLVSDRIKHLPA